MDKVKFCKICYQNNLRENKEFLPFWVNTDICPMCQNKDLLTYNISSEDLSVLLDINSRTFEFIEAMIKLKEDDIIEYESRMAQFRIQIEQQRAIEEQKSSKAAQPTCPACGSTNIQLGTKGFSLVTGFIGSNSPRYYCLECHHKWKPGSVTESITRAWNNK